MSDSSSSNAKENTTDLRDADFSQDGNPQGAATEGGSGGDVDSELARLKRESEENHDKYIRALADFENYKKRALKERSDLLKYQGERILTDLLDVVDNLELALKAGNADPSNPNQSALHQGALRQGVELIYKKFVDTLARWEVCSVPVVGKEFDPARCEAVSRVPVHDAKPGTVINELRKAYVYKDKLLRVGQVVLAEAPSTGEGAANGDAPINDATDESDAGNPQS